MTSDHCQTLPTGLSLVLGPLPCLILHFPVEVEEVHGCPHGLLNDLWRDAVVADVEEPSLLQPILHLTDQTLVILRAGAGVLEGDLANVYH